MKIIQKCQKCGNNIFKIIGKEICCTECNTRTKMKRYLRDNKLGGGE